MLTLSGHTGSVYCVAAADDGHVLTGSDNIVKVWRGKDVCTIEAHTKKVLAVAMLPGARFISVSHGLDPDDGEVKLFTFGGKLERTFEVVGK